MPDLTLPWQVIAGSCLEVLPAIPNNSIDAVVTDPPYELGFMGKAWDKSGIAYNVQVWRECLRVLKPGGHLLAFGGSRTYHRLACAVEDAGFDIRDQIMWLYGSGFPKSLDVSKAIDKAAGAEREVVGSYHGATNIGRKSDGKRGYGHDGEFTGGTDTTVRITAPATDLARQWQGWGTALKPAHEPIVVARKPIDGTVAENVTRYGTGAINVDGCRVGTDVVGWGGASGASGASGVWNKETCRLRNAGDPRPVSGRWPANIIHDGSDEVVEGFPEGSFNRPVVWKREEGKQDGTWNKDNCGFRHAKGGEIRNAYADSGSAARFFYVAKASKADRGEGNGHPTVKPTTLMRYLCRLVTPPGGLVLDPFTGSGSTGRGAVAEGFRFIGIELSEEYAEIARRRIAAMPEPLIPC